MKTTGSNGGTPSTLNERSLGERFSFLASNPNGWIADLQFPTHRTPNLLRGNSITLFSQLADMTEEDLLGIRKFGARCLAELLDALNAHMTHLSANRREELLLEALQERGPRGLTAEEAAGFLVWKGEATTEAEAGELLCRMVVEGNAVRWRDSYYGVQYLKLESEAV